MSGDSSLKAPLVPDLESQLEDFEDLEENPSGSSYGAVSNLLTSIIGAGIMALPATQKHLGVVIGTMTIILIGLLTDASVEILVRFSKACKALTYASIMENAYGKSGRIALQICVIVNNVGLLVVYLIIIGDVLSGTTTTGAAHHTGVLEEWAGGSFWWNSRFFILLLTAIFVLLPLNCFRQIERLQHSSLLSVLLAVVFLVVTAGIFIVKLWYGEIGAPRLWPEVHDQFSFWNLFTAIPVIVTAYICHHSVHPILVELEEPNKMQMICRTALTICTGVYIATGLFGYLLFGENTMADVLSNFDADLGISGGAVASAIVRIFYALHLMLVFPVIHFSLRTNLDSLVFPNNPVSLNDHDLRFFSVTGGLLIFIFVSATMIPNIWTVFQFTGATAAVCLGFIFPGMIALRDTSKIATAWDKRNAWIMVILAVLSSVTSITTNIINIASNKND